ncbi:MAG: phosphoribosylaminoimidazolesuccinocarboxamide synthase [Myxococcota bacterium]|nr:phosphoribosylaminoimidazolesuccinocarboxamide synthase [Myxococcota bacterium]
MTARDHLRERLADNFIAPDLNQLNHLGDHYKGKVRDLFRNADEMVMITSDRLSAFDVVLTSVPCKGAILNAITLKAFEQTKDICDNHIIGSPHPNVLHVRRAEPLKAEIIVRRYITGSLWRDYQAGKAGVYEVPFADDLKRDQRFDAPIITPSTKADVGEHDEPISRRGLVEGGYVEQALLDEACEVAVKLFERGEALAAERGLILVDTKYEFGLIDGKLVVIDEIHTADSSRYWVADEYQTRFDAGESQKMLDKENIRQWLIGQGYQGEGEPPVIPDDVRLDLAEKYLELYERLMGEPFDVGTIAPPSELYASLKSN